VFLTLLVVSSILTYVEDRGVVIEAIVVCYICEEWSGERSVAVKSDGGLMVCTTGLDFYPRPEVVVIKFSDPLRLQLACQRRRSTTVPIPIDIRRTAKGHMHSDHYC